MQNYAESQLNKGLSKSKIHLVKPDDHKEYYEKLAQIADVEKIPDVYTKMFVDTVKNWQKNPFEYSKYKYIIINDKLFIKERETKSGLIAFIDDKINFILRLQNFCLTENLTYIFRKIQKDFMSNLLYF